MTHKRRYSDAFRRTPTGSLLCNFLLLYILYTLTRAVFVACNWSLFGSHLSTGYLIGLFVAGLRFDTTAILYLNLPLILCFLLPLHWKERPGFYRAVRVGFVIINGIGLGANLCDCAYFPFSGRRTTWSVMQEFGGEADFWGIIRQEMLPYWYLVIIGLALFWALWHFFCTPAPLTAKKKGLPAYYVGQTLALALAAGLAIGGIRGGFTKAVRPITLSNANQYVTQAIDAGIVLNTPFSLIRTMDKKPFVEPQYMSMEEAERIWSPVKQPSSKSNEEPSLRLSPKGGAGRGPNVVILILESFGRQAQEEGFMPFVDSLAHVGRSFAYSYANGRKSIDAMPSVLAGIPCFVEPFFLTPAALNDISGIAGELTRHKGYHSAFFHGAENGSMGFQAFARSSGFTDYYGRTEYEADPHYGGRADFDGTWAIWDEEFLQFFCDKMTEMPEPFVTGVFTASSHSPFRVPSRYEGRFREGSHPLFATISYSDHAVRRFFEKASRQPWYGNTLFVITADHTSMQNAPAFTTDLGLYAVPVIFYAPGLPALCGVDNERVVSQADIMPTVLGLMGYDRPYVAFGQDALNTPPAETFAVNYLTGSDLYQFIQGEWLIQYDGREVVHAYRYRTDPLLRHDLRGQQPAEYTRRLQAVIQQYMHRMNKNELVVK